jgi:hypothetical protein
VDVEIRNDDTIEDGGRQLLSIIVGTGAAFRA